MDFERVDLLAYSSAAMMAVKRDRRQLDDESVVYWERE
jgi:hypothetical protein